MMGVQVDQLNPREEGGEPVADLALKCSQRFKAPRLMEIWLYV